ncbi:hypothetical protein COT42_06815 [Candidatus Saganbacteria bacterium CG08_land_8_20_14_0_20_45_16]|uniref:Uncharacterized protein n=1 Tax=Candidatus Saganbacteria bacterium CG08_land_8_20_14_0_20_45_16 TaxID=2014293 RepID=A0A2H0XVD9_UNCSA|nr:MAG: hypothetical protein COT42_06815 [Candidatus Saganbacteria bacterium CG08_land_8_20_14_0_20_45_16]
MIDGQVMERPKQRLTWSRICLILIARTCGLLIVVSQLPLEDWAYLFQSILSPEQRGYYLKALEGVSTEQVNEVRLALLPPHPPEE